jgi:hypothetical protein
VKQCRCVRKPIKVNAWSTTEQSEDRPIVNDIVKWYGIYKYT